MPMHRVFATLFPLLFSVKERRMADLSLYSGYEALRVQRRPNGVLEIVMSGAGVNRSSLATADERMHRELADIWRDVDRDPDTRVAVIRGEGKGFSAGGDLALVEQMANDFEVRARVWREARDLVYNVINCGKPIVSAMHGPAVGAGLVAGLLADVSIAAKNARIIDGHTRLGVAAGDHAAIVWPLLCGMAKAKYHLLLCEALSGEEAERIGLVALAVDEADLLAKAYEVAERLAHGSQTALRWTKYALNNWLRMAGPTFDASLALEFMGFSGPDVHEGIRSLRERRAPDFKGGAPF
jgi:enoyl-CoA hydratase